MRISALSYHYNSRMKQKSGKQQKQTAQKSQMASRERWRRHSQLTSELRQAGASWPWCHWGRPSSQLSPGPSVPISGPLPPFSSWASYPCNMLGGSHGASSHHQALHQPRRKWPKKSEAVSQNVGRGHKAESRWKVWNTLKQSKTGCLFLELQSSSFTNVYCTSLREGYMVSRVF